MTLRPVPPATRPARPWRRGIVAFAAILLVLVAAHAGAWVYVTGRILDGVPAFVAQAAREGWTIRTSEARRGGWPLAATIHLPGVTATRQLGGTAFTWTTEQLDLSIRADSPGALRIAPRGEGSVRLGDAAAVPLRAAFAAYTVPLDGEGPHDLTVRDLVLGTAAAGLTVPAMEARIGPGVVAGTFGPAVPAPPFPAPFDTGATLAGRVVATPPIPAAPTPGRSAAAWQAAGGRVTMPELRLDWGPLHVTGTVEAGLDTQLQPMGQARLQVTGALEVLEAASRAGTLQPGPVAAARAVLTLLTLAAKGGPIALPVTLRDRTLTVAQFALLQLPPIAWDAP